MTNALVTGATSGIGRAIALALAAAGYKTYALGRNTAALGDLGNLPNIIPLAADLADREAVGALVEGLEIDILINNAGVVPQVCGFAETDAAEIDATIEVNLSAALHLTHALLPGMLARRRGDLIFTGSTAGHAPTELVPGRVETSLYRGVFDEEQRARMYADAQAVQPEEIAAMVLAALALPQGSSIARIDIVPTRPTTPAGARG
jgi:3-hydroxy acid dehydrogenase/malonic semialdehyde reductase